MDVFLRKVLYWCIDAGICVDVDTRVDVDVDGNVGVKLCFSVNTTIHM